MKAFWQGVLGFVVAATVSLLIYALFSSVWEGGYDAGYKCAAYGLHCRSGYEKVKP